LLEYLPSEDVGFGQRYYALASASRPKFVGLGLGHATRGLGHDLGLELETYRPCCEICDFLQSFVCKFSVEDNKPLYNGL